MARVLELFWRQTNQVHRRVTTNLIEEVAQAKPTIATTQSLEPRRDHDQVVIAIRQGAAGGPVIAHLVSASPAASSPRRTRSVSASFKRVIGRPTTFVTITPRSISAVLNAPRAEAVGPTRPGVPE